MGSNEKYFAGSEKILESCSNYTPRHSKLLQSSSDNAVLYSEKYAMNKFNAATNELTAASDTLTVGVHSPNSGNRSEKSADRSENSVRRSEHFAGCSKN
ncbi:MAG: hypothetical protein ACOCVA_09210, partial [Prolixibacteraceae bacterium]